MPLLRRIIANFKHSDIWRSYQHKSTHSTDIATHDVYSIISRLYNERYNMHAQRTRVIVAQANMLYEAAIAPVRNFIKTEQTVMPSIFIRPAVPPRTYLADRC